MADVAFTVFTKPWKTMPVARLGDLVRSLGFDGIGQPVRPGFQVEPANVARQLFELGVSIYSVAEPTDERLSPRTPKPAFM